MRLVYDAIQQVAGSSINVLIRGESGTGKELAARAIVALSRRANKPYIRVNCAALPENLIESELFGSERGAFTGATESRPGQIELADGGTLFLDEIATLTVPLQTKLLRVLEDHLVQRLGGRTQRKIDFRLICATNEALEEMIRTGRFREDLYYRIHVIPIDLPPLRERIGDVPFLCDYFFQVHCVANGLPVKRISADALKGLENVARDAYGHVRLADVPIGSLLRDRVRERLTALGIEATVLTKDIGYELRCAKPVAFDVDYTRTLGYGAVRYLLAGGSGALIALSGGRVQPVALESLVDPQTGRIRTRQVDVYAEAYAVARDYMVRLEPRDFEAPQLAQLAAQTNLPPALFREQFVRSVASSAS
jgi:hypothetical protein